MTFRTDAVSTGSYKASQAFAAFAGCREAGFELMKSGCFDNVQMGVFNFSQVRTKGVQNQKMQFRVFEPNGFDMKL